MVQSQTLPEIARMPCASLFAVCFLSGTRQKATLPCATVKTHDKKTHGKIHALPCADTRQRLCRVFFFLHTAK